MIRLIFYLLLTISSGNNFIIAQNCEAPDPEWKLFEIAENVEIGQVLQNITNNEITGMRIIFQNGMMPLKSRTRVYMYRKFLQDLNGILGKLLPNTLSFKISEGVHLD